MPRETKQAEAALQKLGQRVRAGWAKKHPISERSRQTVRTAVREVWEGEAAHCGKKQKAAIGS